MIDTELLLAHVLQKDRTYLLAHPNTPLSPEQQQQFDELVARRKAHEPIAYIIEEKEFYGRSFYVDKRVLIPRPSTETLIDEVKNLFECRFEIKTPRMIEADAEIAIFSHIYSHAPSIRRYSVPTAPRYAPTRDDIIIIDVGTGSGCIAITLALEIPKVKIIATDISQDALDVAKENAKRHGVYDRIEFVHCDGLPGDALRLRSPLRGARSAQHDILYLLVSNPPYIPEPVAQPVRSSVEALRFRAAPLPPDVLDYEPHTALFAGTDGMDILTKLHNQCANDPHCIGEVYECRLEQAKKLKDTL